MLRSLSLPRSHPSLKQFGILDDENDADNGYGMKSRPMYTHASQ